MHISGIDNTELFVGTEADPRQVVRVRLAETDRGGRVELSGAGVTGSAEFDAGTDGVEVGVTAAVAGPMPVTAQLFDRTGAALGPAVPAEFRPAEPGWQVWLIPHFHYDPVWWNTQAAYTETWDQAGAEAQRFRTAFQQTGFALVKLHLDTARQDPDYRFVLAEVDYLKPYWDAHPEDRAYLRRLLAEGRLEIVGGTYNEPNTNLTGPETTVRNFVYGDGFQRGVLGADPATAWQLDVFGHDPQFPGLAADAGLTSSSWARGPFHQWGPMLWTAGPRDGWGDPSVMQFPAEFEWISPSGRGVLTHYMPAHYSAGWQIDSKPSLAEAERAVYELFLLLKRVAATRNVLLPVGTDYTPPSKWVTEIHRDWPRHYVWPKFRCAVPGEFFAAVRAELTATGRQLTPQTRDMNPIYTGKDVSFIDTKQAQRQAENLLLDAEKFATVARLHGAAYPHELMDKAWRQLVYGAHHDAITGSESDQVYLDLLTGWREAHDIGRSVLDAATGYLDRLLPGPEEPATTLTAFNPSGWARSDLVTLRVELPGWPGVRLVDPAGRPQPILLDHLDHDGSARLRAVELTFRAEVPAFGVATGWQLLPAPAEPGDRWQPAAGCTISSDRFRITVDPERGGGVSEFFDAAVGRNLIAAGAVGNELLLYGEYSEHPRFHEGPWHLVPDGRRSGSAAGRAVVRRELCALGERLVVTGELAGIGYRQHLTLWRGSDRLDCVTSLDGFTGADDLVRLRWPTDVPGGLPVSEVGAAVVGRGFGLIDVDSAEHPWTLDNPAHGWFGLSATMRVRIQDQRANLEPVERAIGVAELVGPNGESGSLTRALAVALAGQGVTATAARGDGPRYGRLAVDSNLPDVRIAIGSAAENQFVAERLATADPQYRRELDRQLAETGRARVWIPADRPLAEVWQPSADLSDPASLPVLVVAGPGALAALTDDVADAVLEVSQRARAETAAEPSWAGVTIGLLNRGIPGFAVDTSGALHLSLLRSCTGWPSGVWIDPPRRSAADGSHFQQEHWSQRFEYAVTSGCGDWRQAGLVAAGHDYNHGLQARVHAGGPGGLPARHSFLSIESSSRVVLAAVKPAGNPLAGGNRAAGDDIVIRVYEPAGARPALALQRHGKPIALRRLNILEQASAAAAEPDRLGPMEIATFGLSVPAPVVAEHPYGDGHEPHQPIFSRYWLNNTGPAPRGNVPVSVHLEPLLISEDGPAELSVVVSGIRTGPDACGEVELLLPDGWSASARTVPYRLDQAEYVREAITVTPAPGASPGSYWVRARIGSGGQLIEDVTRFLIGQLTTPELSAELLEPELVVAAGGETALTLRLISAARTEISVQAQLVGPWPTWGLTPRWQAGRQLAPGEQVELSFPVRVPLGAAAGEWWLLAKVAAAGDLHYTAPVRLVVTEPASERSR